MLIDMKRLTLALVLATGIFAVGQSVGVQRTATKAVTVAAPDGPLPFCPPICDPPARR